MSSEQSPRLDSRRYTYKKPSSINILLNKTILGSSADNIVSHFAVNYHKEAGQLGIDLDELYSALLADGEINPPEWNIHGRQVNVYKYVYLYRLPRPQESTSLSAFRRSGYVPFAVLDVSSTGRQTREGSRTLEVNF